MHRLSENHRRRARGVFGDEKIMRAVLSDYQFLRTKNLAETLKLLANEPVSPFAGGTDLMVLFESGQLPAGKYVDILFHKELAGIKKTKDKIVIGATASYSDILDEPVVEKEFPNLWHAAKETGATATQNR